MFFLPLLPLLLRTTCFVFGALVAANDEHHLDSRILPPTIDTNFNFATAKKNFDWIGLPANYEQLLASEKRAILFDKLTSSEYSANSHPSRWEWHSNINDSVRQLYGATPDALAQAFVCNAQNADIKPLDRQRLVHDVGIVGLIEFRMFAQNAAAAANSFTGLLAAGATTIGIARFSLSADPRLPPGYLPGMGVKLFIDGKPSANIVTSFDLDGNGENTNFFLKPLRTSLPCPLASYFKKLVEIFEKAEHPGSSLPVRHLTQTTATGEKVANASYPFMLIFEPHERLQNLLPSNSTQDFRDDLAQNVTPGPLYYVYAASAVDDPKPVRIGLLTLTSRLVQSYFGDARLCFRHHRNKFDLDELLTTSVIERDNLSS